MIFNQDIIDKIKKFDNRSKMITATTGSTISTQILEYTQGGYNCIFPFKTIEITETIFIPSNANVDFNFTTIKRKAGLTNIFDLISNTDATNGNMNIRISNLLIDGNRQVDSLVNTNDDYRFSGLKLTKVTGVSEISNVTVINTVNNEELQTTPASGIFYVNCSGLKFNNINGWDNLGTAIFNVGSSKCTIDGSLTYNNTGSGIGGYGDECNFLNIDTHNNGYSNLSVNGKRCIVDNVRSYSSGCSGLNIGQDTATAYADDAVISNIHSYNNSYEGITVTHSDRVKIVNINVYGNAIDTTRENIRVSLSNSTKWLNIISHDCTSIAIKFYNGIGHTIDSSEFYGCGVGMYVDSMASVVIGNTVKIHNNTDGVILATASKCNLVGCEIYTNSRYGIQISGGTGHKLLETNIYGNTTLDIYEMGSPTDIYYNYNQAGVDYKKTGFVELNHSKLSIVDETATGLFTILMPVQSRVLIDFTITAVYPSNTNGSIASVKGLATCLTNETGAMTNNISSTLVSSTSLSGVTSSTITPVIVNDETGDKLTFSINQNNETLDVSLTVSVSAKITYFIGGVLTKPIIVLI